MLLVRSEQQVIKIALVLNPLLVAVMKHCDKSNFRKEGLFWLTVLGYSPSWCGGHESRILTQSARLNLPAGSRRRWMLVSNPLSHYSAQDPSPENDSTQ